MKIFITGATGFIGRALVLRLQREGHSLTALARNPEGARSQLGADVHVLPADMSDEMLREVLSAQDAVVNLAGEPLIGRWTKKRRERIVESRVGLTERLVEAMAASSSPPRVLVSGSAVGFYGDRGDEMLTEESAPGADFLATLCADWEDAALSARAFGTRVVVLRTGIVLGSDGGALARLLLPFRLGLGGPIGSGRQYMPWIHLHDHVEMISAALQDDRWEGAVNAVGPAPVTNREFARALGRALRRPAFMPLPGFALKAVLGESAFVLLTGQRALPARAEALGFRFAHATIDDALADIAGGRGAPVDIRAVERP
jgi:uncharacterized protein (TIGR01777 family)